MAAKRKKKRTGMVVTTMRLPAELLGALDKKAAKQGKSRTGFFIDMIRAAHENGEDAVQEVWDAPAPEPAGIFE